MIQKKVRNTLTFALMLTGMAATAVQAGDIKPLHHTCYQGNAINWPKPVVAGSPAGLVNGTNAQGGSGVIAAGATTKDQLRFTCPAGTKSFELNIRSKTAGQNARAAHMPVATGPSITDATGGNTVWGSVATKNKAAGATTWDVQVDRASGSAALNYEMCVACYSAINEGGTLSQPSSASYLLNQ